MGNRLPVLQLDMIRGFIKDWCNQLFEEKMGLERELTKAKKNKDKSLSPAMQVAQIKTLEEQIGKIAKKLGVLSVLATKLPSPKKNDTHDDRTQCFYLYLKSMGFEDDEEVLGLDKVNPLNVFENIKFCYNSRQLETFKSLVIAWIDLTKGIFGGSDFHAKSLLIFNRAIKRLEEKESEHLDKGFMI